MHSNSLHYIFFYDSDNFRTLFVAYTPGGRKLCGVVMSELRQKGEFF